MDGVVEVQGRRGHAIAPPALRAASQVTRLAARKITPSPIAAQVSAFAGAAMSSPTPMAMTAAPMRAITRLRSNAAMMRSPAPIGNTGPTSDAVPRSAKPATSAQATIPPMTSA